MYHNLAAQTKAPDMNGSRMVRQTDGHCDGSYRYQGRIKTYSYHKSHSDSLFMTPSTVEDRRSLGGNEVE